MKDKIEIWQKMPREYFSIHKETKEVRYYNDPLFRPGRIGPDSYGEPKWDHWIDTRYAAKVRLFNYINKIPPRKPYRPYEGTQIGISIPILNF